MYNRFKEFVPSKNLENMSIDEVESDVGTAFEIIGFNCPKSELAFTKAWEKSEVTTLLDFVYDIWVICNEL